MEGFALTGTAILIIISCILFFVNSKYYYYSIFIIYPIVGQSIRMKFAVFGHDINLSMVYGIFILFFAIIDFVKNIGMIEPLKRLIPVFLFFCIGTAAYSAAPFFTVTWSVKLATCFMLLLTTMRIFKKKEDLVNLGYLAMIAAGIVAFSHTLSYLGICGEQRVYEEGMKIHGAGYDSGQVISYFLALNIPLITVNIVLKRGRKIAMSFLCLSLLVILLTFVRAPVIALVLGYLYFLYLMLRFKLKQTIAGVLVGLIALAMVFSTFYYLQGKASSKRWGTFTEQIEKKEYKKLGSGRLGGLMLFKDYFMHKENVAEKLFGVGLGSSITLLGMRCIIHNDFAEILMGCGLVGLAIYLLILFKIHRLLLSLIRSPIPKEIRVSVAVALMNYVCFLFLHFGGLTTEIFALSAWAIHTGATIGVASEFAKDTPLRNSRST